MPLGPANMLTPTSLDLFLSAASLQLLANETHMLGNLRAFLVGSFVLEGVRRSCKRALIHTVLCAYADQWNLFFPPPCTMSYRCVTDSDFFLKIDRFDRGRTDANGCVPTVVIPGDVTVPVVRLSCYTMNISVRLPLFSVLTLHTLSAVK